MVVDASSTDRTAAIARDLGARVFVRPFDCFGGQKNAAQEAARGTWILSLDADEVVSPALANEILARLSELADSPRSPATPVAFRIPIRLEFLGKALRFGRDTVVRPIRLYRRDRARFTLDPVHERVAADGPVDALDELILHRSYRDLSHYMEKLNLYTTLAAEVRIRSGRQGARFLPLRVAWEFLDRFVLRLGFLDGAPGLTYAVLSSAYTLVKFMKLRERQSPGELP